MPHLRFLIPAFFLLIFLIRYYDFFFLYQPVTISFVEIQPPTLESFIVFNYFLKVLFYSFKFLFVSILVFAGIFFVDDNRDHFKEVFSIVLVSEFVFIVGDIYKIVYFTFFATDYTEVGYMDFFPLSLYSIFPTDSNSLNYLVRSLNFFEVAYILSLIWGLHYTKCTNRPATVVLSSYGIFLLVWISAVLLFKIE